MLDLAKQLIKRQTGTYDPSDVEDRYEARLRAVIDAKLKGEGVAVGDDEEPDQDNVIDLMTALKRSLGEGGKAKRATKGKAPAKKRTAR
jgi:DNA end-binding protein Ku